MDKVKFENKIYSLAKETIKRGETLEFHATKKDGRRFHISDIKGVKVISLFPAINTFFCDKQTKAIATYAKKFKKVTFITISTDEVETQNKWCEANGVDNIIILSDANFLDFARTTGAYIPEREQLIRGFIVLDKNNKIKAISLNDEVQEEPDYELLDSLL